MFTIILGSGIIGLSTAYYLSETVNSNNIHLVDSSPRLFASASGYSGGFLAADWFSPAVSELGKLSFAEHKRLADKFGGGEKWGYLPGTALNFVPGDETSNKRGDDWLRDGTSRAQVANGDFEEVDSDHIPAWLNHHQGSVEVIGELASTAVVDPLKLCKFLLAECEARGVHVHFPYKATSVRTNDSGVLSGLSLYSLETGEELHLSCSKLVISAGSWSPRVFKTLFPKSKTRIPISSLAGHSVVMRSPRWLKEHEGNGGHAVFTTDSSGFSPEIFSRRGEEIWCGGLNDANLTLPDVPTDFTVDEAAIEQLLMVSRKLLGLPSGEDDLQIVRKGLCSRPSSKSGKPIITRIADSELGGVNTAGGVFLSAGHGPWGISLSLGTGKVTAELVQGKKTSADIKGLRL